MITMPLFPATFTEKGLAAVAFQVAPPSMLLKTLLGLRGAKVLKPWMDTYSVVGLEGAMASCISPTAGAPELVRGSCVAPEPLTGVQF